MTAPDASQQAAVDAALLVLKSMGLSLEDLTAAPGLRAVVPTFAEYVPVVAATLTPAPCGRTAPTGIGPSCGGASGAWTSRRRRRSSSSWRTSR